MLPNKRDRVSDLLVKLDHLTFVAEYDKKFKIGDYAVTEDTSSTNWTATDGQKSKTFTTRMAAISWAKFMSEDKVEQARIVEEMSKELDGATTHVRQLIKASQMHPQVIGKIDPANDKRVSKVGKLADYILKNS